LVGAAGVEADLHGDVDEIGGLGPDMLGLHGVLVGAERGDALFGLVTLVVVVVAVHVLEEGLELGGFAPVALKVLRGPGDLALHPLAGGSLLGVGDGGEEVAGCLAGRAGPALALEEGPGCRCRAEVDLAAGVQHGDLVEGVVDGLAGLVHSDGVGVGANVGRHSQGVHKLQRAGRVQATSTVVPRRDGRSRNHHLGNADTLPLAARHAADVIVADLGVVRVRQPKHGHVHPGDVLAVLIPLHVLDAFLGCPTRGGKLQRLADP